MSKEEGPDDSTRALSQRTSGRRSRRKQVKQLVVEGEEDDDSNDDGNSEITSKKKDEIILRRPRPDIELQIDAAIEARKQQRLALLETTAAEDASTHENDDKPNDGSENYGNYEYLDHTADVQIHSWGDTFEEALEQLVIAMFGYMTPLGQVKINEEQSHEHGELVKAQGHDAESAVFAFMQEYLSIFHESGFVVRTVQVVELDKETWVITSNGHGEVFDPSRHAQGTEIKAITYSNLQVVMDPNNTRCDIWVIVDI